MTGVGASRLPNHTGKDSLLAVGNEHLPMTVDYAGTVQL